MFTRKGKTFVMVLIGVVMVAGAFAIRIAPTAAHPLTPAPAGATIPYSGNLLDQWSNPVADGSYDFILRLYNAQTDGVLLWSEEQEDVAVLDGSFTILLGNVSPLPKEALSGEAQWLEVSVRGAEESEYTLLSPRLRLDAAAPAGGSGVTNNSSCAHTHLGETWTATSDSPGLHLVNTGTSISGFSSNHEGILGSSSASNASGVEGWNISTGWGVHGRSEGGSGVFGESPISDGVRGESGGSNKSGVYGFNNSAGYGVFGRSTTGYGGGFTSTSDQYDLFLGGSVGRINANEQADSQLYLSSNGNVIIKLDNDGGGDNALYIQNSGGQSVCSMTENGTFDCLGSKSAVVETANYGLRSLYAMESPEVWFEDFGSAALTDGEAFVTFEPIFAETVNLQEDYYVFLVPLTQEPVLLFVTSKSETGFIVRGVTLEGKPAQGAFDYRIVARRLGYEDIRLAPPPAGFANGSGHQEEQ